MTFKNGILYVANYLNQFGPALTLENMFFSGYFSRLLPTNTKVTFQNSTLMNTGGGLGNFSGYKMIFNNCIISNSIIFNNNGIPGGFATLSDCIMSASTFGEVFDESNISYDDQGGNIFDASIIDILDWDSISLQSFNLYKGYGIDTLGGWFRNFSYNQSQFDWSSPTDYPFTPNNDLYDKDIDYILANKKKLRPFDGITSPPNPGYNFSAYPGYETGLFGYMRKDYITSGA